MNKIISIMADFGMAPYAWIKEKDVPYPAVGPCLVDSVAGWDKEYPVSNELHKKFSEWAIDFECNCDNDDFNWEVFNQKGLELSKLLKSEIGHLFKIYYVKAAEDPTEKINTETEV